MRKNLNDIIRFYRQEGFSLAQAEQRCVQDVVLSKIESSPCRGNMTLKGGVVLYERSQAQRRATMDIDLDVIHFGIDDGSLLELISLLNQVDDGVFLKVSAPFEELRQQDYRGKRVRFKLNDTFGGSIANSKIDFGVETKGAVGQTILSFVDYSGKKINLLANSNEQIFAEKCLSLLRHGIKSTRYKDFADMVYLATSSGFNAKKMQEILRQKSPKMVGGIAEIKERVISVCGNQRFRNLFSSQDYYWVSIPFAEGYEEVIHALE